jgi:ring-1,2-phenylacetyl-CoA epoxidase subunit PaaD
MHDDTLFQPGAFPAVECPYCGSAETEFFSLFGSQLLTAQYYCRACHTPFEQIKNDEVLAEATRRALAEDGHAAGREARYKEK